MQKKVWRSEKGDKKRQCDRKGLLQQEEKDKRAEKKTFNKAGKKIKTLGLYCQGGKRLIKGALPGVDVTQLGKRNTGKRIILRLKKVYDTQR